MKKSFKRVLSMALVVIMLTLMIPTGVFTATAAEAVAESTLNTLNAVDAAPNVTMYDSSVVDGKPVRTLWEDSKFDFIWVVKTADDANAAANPYAGTEVSTATTPSSSGPNYKGEFATLSAAVAALKKISGGNDNAADNTYTHIIILLSDTVSAGHTEWGTVRANLVVDGSRAPSGHATLTVGKDSVASAWWIQQHNTVVFHDLTINAWNLGKTSGTYYEDTNLGGSTSSSIGEAKTGTPCNVFSLRKANTIVLDDTTVIARQNGYYTKADATDKEEVYTATFKGDTSKNCNAILMGQIGFKRANSDDSSASNNRVWQGDQETVTYLNATVNDVTYAYSNTGTGNVTVNAIHSTFTNANGGRIFYSTSKATTTFNIINSTLTGGKKNTSMIEAGGSGPVIVNIVNSTLTGGNEGVNMIKAGSSGAVTVNIVNSELYSTAKSAHILNASNTGTMTINMKGATLESSSSGKLIYESNKGHIDVHAEDTTFHCTGSGQMLHVEYATAVVTDDSSMSGVFKNCTFNNEGSGILVRSTAGGVGHDMDFTFEDCTVYTNGALFVGTNSASAIVKITLRNTKVEKAKDTIDTANAIQMEQGGGELHVDIDSASNLNTSGVKIYAANADAKLRVTFNGWNITDDLDTQLAVDNGTKFFSKKATDVALTFENCTTNKALTEDVFSTIQTNIGATAFGLNFKNSTIKSTQYIAKNPTAKTYSVDIVDSTLETSADKVVTNYTKNAVYNLSVSGNTTLKSTNKSGYVFYFNQSYPTSLTANIYDGTFTAYGEVLFYTDDSNHGGKMNIAAGATSVEKTNSEETEINIFDGSFNTVQYEGQRSFGLIDVRGLKATTNIYGGEFNLTASSLASNAVTEIVMIAAASNMNIYGGTFVNDNDAACSQLLRHSYRLFLDTAALTTGPYFKDADKTKLSVYGGTFVTGYGAVVSAGTSNSNGHYGNVDIYDGVFVKTKAVNGGVTGYTAATSTDKEKVSTGSGYGIIADKNTGMGNVTASAVPNGSVYNIYGGVWVTPTANEVFGYKIQKLTSGSGYSNGNYNRQYANNTYSAVTINSTNYANAGISDKAWEAMNKNGTLDTTKFTAEVVVPNTPATYRNYGVFGGVFLQIKNGTTTADTKTDLRVLVEIDRTVANNVQFAEISYKVALTEDMAGAIETVDEYGQLFDSVKEANGNYWTPAEGKALAVLNIKNIRNTYFTEGNVFYVQAYLKTTSGNIYTTDVIKIDATNSCKADIKGAEKSAT
jgi:hypothetical protein